MNNLKENATMTNLIIYHANCTDGITAAAIAYKGLDDFSSFSQANLHPAHYGSAPPNVEDMNVYIVDFSYPREVLEEMHKEANSLVVLDHHKTAEKDLEGLDYCIFDMSRSGAMLAWDFFYPFVEVPTLVEYVQDRDLWEWKLPNSKEVSAALMLVPKTVKEFRKLLEKDQLTSLVEKGKTILEYQNTVVHGQITNATELEFNGDTVPVINTGILISETLNELAKGQKFAVAYFDVLRERKRVYSLRSAPDGVDVSVVAKKFGGGGHKHAAGFTVSLDELYRDNCWKDIK